MSAPAKLIVCERTSRWAVALRRAGQGTGIRVLETRSLDECWSELRQSPASFLALELLPSNARSVGSRLWQLTWDWPQARAAVLTDRPWREADWLTREAGAVHLIVSPRELAPLWRMIVRHMEAVPQPEISERERIWQQLPWK